MGSSATLSETMSWLNQAGYVADLNCLMSVIHAEPTAFTIDAIYRFEGPTDPGDEVILYAISSGKYGQKGMLVNAYGAYADSTTANLEQRLCLSMTTGSPV